MSTPTTTPVPKSRKQLENEKRAAYKANNYRVYVSGLQGQQNLETAVAYYYRGHYLYAQHGNPVEPVPFSTRTGIKIQGTTTESAPRFRPDDLGLVLESSIGHLRKTQEHFWPAQKADNTEGIGLEHETTRTPVLKAAGPAHKHAHTTPPQAFTPHGRAMFLSDSAPTSRAPSTPQTPVASRPTTPLRKTASHSRVASLLTAEVIRRGRASPLAEIREGKALPT